MTRKFGHNAVDMAVPNSFDGFNESNPEGLALLLTCKDLEVKTTEPLLCSVMGDATECVKLLLSDTRVDPNIPMGAPLRDAVKGRKEVLEPLI